ncbi:MULTISPECIES: DUF3180 domain-containing protein [Kocuria]|uniref:DUF3180 domain-containing protein n=1 Tax=Kocuria TaxID=57493 RepID=UPI000660E19E|nr:MULTISPECIES: DUF3180 domain-containing protein [Kocuria]MCT1368465.1 DUF3180 domain-containing protein [Rothia sp. p3-SID1597]RUQ21905.1 DUF3180 domain-containing protein [Kocuria sp. HSID16901]
MKPLRYRWLALMAAIALAVSGVACGLWPDVRRVVFTVPWVTLAFSVVLALVALALAWRVRAYTKEPKRRPINAVFASRIAVLAQTCAVYGALLFGWAGGLLLYDLSLLRYRSVTENLPLTVANVVVGFGVCVAGCLAETWCKRPPDDPTDSQGSRDARAHDYPEGEGGYARHGDH